MDAQTRLGLELAGTALALGLLGDLLLRATPWGLNAFIWIACLIAAGCFLSLRWHSQSVATDARLLLPLVALALLFLGRDAILLKTTTAVGVMAALAFGIQRAQWAHLKSRANIPNDPPPLLVSGLRAVVAWPRFLVQDIDWRSIPIDQGGHHTKAVARGVLLAVPVMAIFGTLLVSADATFAHALTYLTDVNIAKLPGHLLLLLGFAWITGSFFRGLLLGFNRPVAEELGTDTKPRLSLGIVEIGTILSLINVLFAAFVLVQLPYFFGGMETVWGSEGLTLAQYARRGFFELVIVTALALPFLLLLRRLLYPTKTSHLRAFNFLAGVQVTMLLVMLASAAQRMWFYQQAYGVTALRLYVSACLIWLSVVLVWFLFTVVRDHLARFMPGAVAAGFVMIVGLHLLNPDAFIVKTNVARIQSDQAFDVKYHLNLSADAVPALLDAMPLLRTEDQTVVARRLINTWGVATTPDWRAWSRSRKHAYYLVQFHEQRLRVLAFSSPPVPSTSVQPSVAPHNPSDS